MSENDEFFEGPTLEQLLDYYMAQRGINRSRLIQLAGISKATAHRWFRGKSKHPYNRVGLLRLAAALELPKVSTNRLLHAAGLPRIDPRVPNDDIEEGPLLARWLAPTTNNLPADLTSFVGREQDVLMVAELICSEHVRMVSLTGAGGSGKTRLSLRVAAELFDVFPDGVYFVPLASISDATLLRQTIAETIGLRDVPDASIHTRLTNWLQSRRVLLVLDNLEHLLDCGSDMVMLMQDAPGLKILATSRIPLEISGEYQWEVDPLPLPLSHTPTPKLRDNPAVDLFLQRARAVAPRYEFDEVDLSIVARICHRLDGLPLAIELAAVRVRDHRLDQLLEDFPSSLDLTAIGPRDVPARHRTLRDAIDWSFNLLDEQEQTALLCLSVFVGGWTKEAAAAVCSHGIGAHRSFDQILQQLHHTNLIVHATDHADRYLMLQTIREYCVERRSKLLSEPALFEQYVTYFLDSLPSLESYIPESRINTQYKRIELEIDNFRAALEWSRQSNRFDLLARLASKLWPFWVEYQRAIEGERWIRLVLENGRSYPCPVRASVLTGACTLYVTLTNFQPGLEYGRLALELWRELGNRRGIALAERQLAWASYLSGIAEPAIELFVGALEEWRAIDDPEGLAVALGDLGLALCIVGRFDQARKYLEQSGTIYQDLGDPQGVARASRDQGLLSLLSGDSASASTLLKQAVAGLGNLGKTYLLASAFFYLGTALCFEESLDGAIAAYLESLRLHEEIGDMGHISLTLLGFAAVAYRQDDGVRAAILCGASEAMRRSRQMTLPPAAKSLYEREIEALLERVDEETFNQGFARGVEMTTGEAVAFARQVSASR